jgi:hypothetical protein
MLKPIVSAMLVAFIAFPAAAVAGAGAERVQAQQYLHPHGIDSSHGMASSDLLPLTFTPRAGDKSVHFDLDDATQGNVIIYVFQTNSAGERIKIRDALCGKKQDVPLVSDAPVEVYLYAGLCVNHNFSYTSSGTVTATFSTRAFKEPAPVAHHHP